MMPGLCQGELPGLHVGIVLDGNGRWAQARGLPRSAGHRRGEWAVHRTIEAAPQCGIRLLTLFVLSSDNWRRPRTEVQVIIDVVERFLARRGEQYGRTGIRLSVLGRRDRLPQRLQDRILETESRTRAGARLHVRLCVDYSARDSILDAARRASPAQLLSRTSFAPALSNETVSGGNCDVDLLIRSGGEQRLSDFLLWECAYAELSFLDILWPDFRPHHLVSAVHDYRRRQRRFGTLVPQRAAIS